MKPGSGYLPSMHATDIKVEALRMSEADRAALALHLLDSLPSVLHEEDDGLAEALRRDFELEQNPGSALTWEAVRKQLGR